MIERLYQPHFSCIFGEKYANAFNFKKIDSLIWPIFEDVEKSKELEALLTLKNQKQRNLFYHRKISLEDLKVELKCSSIDTALIQGMALNREYGITNDDVLNTVKNDSSFFKAILSFCLSKQDSNPEQIINKIEQSKKKVDVVGIALYPSFTNLDLGESDDKSLNALLNYCTENKMFIKIDTGKNYLPKNDLSYTKQEIIAKLILRRRYNVFILSGLNLIEDIAEYYPLLKYYNNLWLEIDPRNFGGQTPTEVFKNLFNYKGFVQNSWHRLTIGSATPTLESSQMMRGFYEATKDLSFSFKGLLRSWAYRNINRINEENFMPINKSDTNLNNIYLGTQLLNSINKGNKKTFSYKLKLRSYSITQLLYITDIIKDLAKKVFKENNEFHYGDLFIRTYHTTTSLIVNEHEQGNYLDLHYKFAEESTQDSSLTLHTVRALENRADFNRFDHNMASKYGSRQLIIPIENGKLEIGGREDFYILITFGPRIFNLYIRFDLYI